MRDPAVEDGEVSRGLEALTLGAVQPLGQVGAAQRRRNDHVSDDSGLGVPPVQTELIPRLGVSPHGQGANPTDRQHAREDVQREQSGPLSATSSNGHVSPWQEGQPGGASSAGCGGEGPRLLRLGPLDGPLTSMTEHKDGVDDPGRRAPP